MNHIRSISWEWFHRFISEEVQHKHQNSSCFSRPRILLISVFLLTAPPCCLICPHVHLFVCPHVSLSVCLFVCVSVLDVNDETPTFNPRVYNVSLKESVPRDHIVTRLSCSDNDAGLNAELSYFITGQRLQWELFCVFVGYRFVQLWGLCAHSLPLSIHPSMCKFVCQVSSCCMHMLY